MGVNEEKCTHEIQADNLHAKWKEKFSKNRKIEREIGI